MIDKKRIAKNTLFLYVRMIITMAIGLFSVRIVLQALGETDYGIYNVVGGVIVMLAFLNNALSSTTQRFLSFELGKEADNQYNEVFNTSCSLYFLLCIVIFVLGETVGLWFVNSKLVIPENRIFAANCVYQFSIASFIFTILCVPFNAAVIAHEKMSFFAYVSIIDACCKLGICVCLLYVWYDKLILYGFLMMAMSLAVLIAYIFYCIHKSLVCAFHWSLRKTIVSKIANFAGWSTFGALSNIFRSQGINFLLNIFFGPAVNAARAIAYQAEAALLTVIQNFYIAVRPQAIKSYADGAIKESINIVFFATKIGYIMMLVLFTIFVFESDYIFNLWLKETPEYAIVYFRIIMLAVLFEALITPLTMLVHANGNVGRYQFFSGIITASSLLIAYLFITSFGDSITPMLAIPIVSVLALVNVIYQVRRLIQFPTDSYLKLLLKLLFVTIVSCVFVFLINKFLEQGFSRLLLTFAVALFVGFASLMFVLDGAERQKIKMLIFKRGKN